MADKHPRVTNEDGTLTGAVDEHGVPVPPTHRDVELLGAHRHAEYMQKREAKIAELEAQRFEAERFERFQREFITTGGAPADARAAYVQMKRDAAASAAREADQLARTATLAHARTEV